MKKIQHIFITLFFTFILSCSTKQHVVTNAQPVDDGKINIIFLQVNDVYEIAPLAGGKEGGMARVATLKKQLVAENSNTYAFMAGDFLSPSLLGTMKYKGQRIKGQQMIEAMNAVGFDLVTFGNHEFDLSKNELQQRLNESNFPWTSANARQKVCGTTYPFYKERNGIKEFVSDTYIIEAKDTDGTTIKIGFFSVILPSNPQSYVEYTDIYKQAKRAYESLRSQTDFVIGLTHVKLSQDKAIAALLPNLPLIMGGHEHNNMLIDVGTTKIAKADANAKTAYIHRIAYDKNTKSIQLKSELKPISDALVADTRTQEIVEKWGLILNDQIKKVVEDPLELIYVAQTPLDGRDKPIRSTQTNLGQMIARSMAYGFDEQVDCALVNGGSVRLDDQLVGNINSLDIFRVLPFGGGILKVELKGRLLKQVLDYGKSKAGTGAYLQRYLAEFDTSNNAWLINGKPIEEDRIYKVAFSDYLLKGYDIPFLKSENKDVVGVYTPTPKEIGSDIRKTMIAYLKSIK